MKKLLTLLVPLLVVVGCVHYKPVAVVSPTKELRQAETQAVSSNDEALRLLAKTLADLPLGIGSQFTVLKRDVEQAQDAAKRTAVHLTAVVKNTDTVDRKFNQEVEKRAKTEDRNEKLENAWLGPKTWRVIKIAGVLLTLGGLLYVASILFDLGPVGGPVKTIAHFLTLGVTWLIHRFTNRKSNGNSVP